MDFSQVLAGPYVGRILAELGADVIKVESPAGDLTRVIAPRFEKQALLGGSRLALDADLVVPSDAPRSGTIGIALGLALAAGALGVAIKRAIVRARRDPEHLA